MHPRLFIPKLGAVKGISELLHTVGSLILVSSFCYIFVDVVFRFFRLPPIGNIIEICSYVDVWIGFLGVGFLVREGSHIRVDLLTSRVSFGKRRMMTMITDIVTMLFCLLMFYKGTELVVIYYNLGQRTIASHFLIWPFQIVVPLGFLFLFLEVIIDFTSSMKGGERGLDLTEKGAS